MKFRARFLATILLAGLPGAGTVIGAPLPGQLRMGGPDRAIMPEVRFTNADLVRLCRRQMRQHGGVLRLGRGRAAIYRTAILAGCLRQSAI